MYLTAKALDFHPKKTSGARSLLNEGKREVFGGKKEMDNKI